MNNIHQTTIYDQKTSKIIVINEKWYNNYEIKSKSIKLYKDNLVNL